MSGRRAEDIEELCAPKIIYTSTITYFLEPEGGESFPNLIDRAELLLSKLARLHSSSIDQKILLVCHGDFGKMVSGINIVKRYKIEYCDKIKNL